MRKRALAGWGVLAAALVAAPLAARPALAPRYGGDLSLALAAVPAELDPARAAGPAALQVARALHATLVEAGPDGTLRAGLLAELPEPEPDGRAFRLRLRPGLRFHDGRPLLAEDVAASLARLLAPSTRSPHGWIALPLQGSDEVREGRASSLAGVQVISDLELRLLLEAPFPDLPRALAALPAAVVARGGPAANGAGPFQLGARGRDGALRLIAFDGHWRGRAYADTLSVAALDARRAARAGARGELDLVVRPEALPGANARDLPPVTATYAIANVRRLGKLGGELRRALEALDRDEMARLAGRGHVVPLATLLPPSLWPSTPAPAPPPPARASGAPRVSILVAAGEGARAVADRLQVKLFDAGIRAAVNVVSPEVLAARLEAGTHDLALVSVTYVATAAPAGLLQAAWALGGPAAARRALSRLAAVEPEAVAAELSEELGVVPLFAGGLAASPGARLQGLRVLPDGTVDPGDLWLAPRRAR